MVETSLEQVMQFNCYRAGLLLRRELMFALKEFDLTPEQWQVLATLWDSQDALSQGEVAELVLKDRHSVSRLIQRLLDKGWIERLDDTADARVVRIQATKKSRRVEDADGSKTANLTTKKKCPRRRRPQRKTSFFVRFVVRFGHDKNHRALQLLRRRVWM